MQRCDMVGGHYKVACTPKELSCIVANLFSEVRPLCDICETMKDEDFVLCGMVANTEDDYAIIKLTEFGCEFYGDIEVLKKIRKTRCPYDGAANTSKKDGGATEQGSLSPIAEVSEG